MLGAKITNKALCVAVLYGNFPLVCKLLDLGAEPESALLAAGANGHTLILAELQKRHATW